MAKDRFHNSVKVALEKDGWTITDDPYELGVGGWTITDDPYELGVGGVEMYIDLGAEQLLGAERDGARIAVEIKSFIGSSSISEFHTAHGQYMDYRYALEEKDPERVLYLAVPVKIYEGFFSLKFIQTAVERSQLRLLIYDPDE